MLNKAFFRKFGALVVMAGVLVCGSVGIYILSTKLFALENIEVAGDAVGVVVNEDQIPKNLLFFPTDRVKTEILRANPLLSALQLKKKFPHTLVVVATRRTPIATIRLESLVGLIDREGYIVGIDDRKMVLPNITFEPMHEGVGDRIEDPGVQAALALISSVPGEFKVQNITRFDRLSVMGEISGMHIVIAQHSDASSISATLQTILDGLRIKGTMPTRIDLRFDKPVIQF